LAGAYTIYDSGFPCQSPTAPTPALVAAVLLEGSIHGDSLETGAFIDAAGSIVIRKTGLPNAVCFVGGELNGTRGTVFTHNHPKDGSFSREDVEAAIRSTLIEVRAVGPKLRHRLRPRHPAWPTLAELNRELAIAQRHVPTIVRNQHRTGAINPQFLRHEAEHQTWVFVSNVLGLDYIRERAWP
jgi:hypothetical protein